jgi:ketosteroid isomerase-like protein
MSHNARGFFGWLVVLALLVATPALAGDVEDFKAAFDQAVKAHASKDGAFFSMMHAQGVVFSPSVPFAQNGKAAYEQYIRGVWAAMDSVTFVPVNPQFKVIGTTGISWGHYAMALKPKDGGSRSVFGRYTAVFAKSGGKWLAVAAHYSALPSGN